MSLRHTPAGRGHPYERDPDQRVPVRPVAGLPLELRATTAAEAEPVMVELDRSGERFRIPAVPRGAALPDDDAVYGSKRNAGSNDGHLTDASSFEAGGMFSAASLVDELRPGEVLGYRFTVGDCETEWFETRVCSWDAADHAVVVHSAPSIRDRFVSGSAEMLTDGSLRYRLRFALRLEADEHVVGFGERFNTLDQRGLRVDTAVYDQYKAQGERSYLPAPFAIVAGRGGSFGFHIATTRRCFFDVGASQPDRLLVEVDLEPGVDSTEVFDVELFAGEPLELVQAFSERTSAEISAPPDWVYRLWLSGNEWNSDQRVRTELACARKAGIPVGALVIEAWSDEQTFTAFNGSEYTPHEDGSPHCLADFSFPPDGPWPDPKQLIDDLHETGVKVLLWQIPLVAVDEGQAGIDRRVMVDRGYCVRRDDGTPYRNLGGWFSGGLLIDFTDPHATDWWLAKRRYLVEELGVDGFKTDGGEHAWGGDLRYADGTRGGESNNRYPVMYQAAYHRLMTGLGRPPVTFSRAGSTGSGGFPCHWAGDEDSTWEAFRASITAGLTAAVSGVFFWGWDIAGFSGPLPSSELYLRATAMAALCPIMQLHSEFNDHRLPSRDRTPWNVAEQTGDDRIVGMFRRFVELRERVVPYLAQAGQRAAADRVPLMRPLFLDYPYDPETWLFPYQYLLGDALLVAPVCEEGVTKWPVYLPAGEWVDLTEGIEIVGGRTITVPAHLDSIPVFCRGEHAARVAPLFAPMTTGELMEVS